MSQLRKSAKDLFLAALDIEPADRPAFLDEVCAGDAALRRQVEALLRVHDEPDSLLDGPRIHLGLSGEGGAPIPDPTIDQTITEGPGTIIGPYKLLQRIGEGGFGVVYMADQTEPVERRVALKIIKPGMDTRQVIARFEAERQALAMMDHPNIAKVLDAGTTASGRPHFVMELVKGVPITTYCDEQHLTPRERLDLFLPVCQAIQHAHQKGIIHRDLKPSNVLIALYDGTPVPKVIDFGVAKATSQRLTEKTMFTLFGQIVGTVEYMSPEQANLNQLDIDTRSDIYSLGVLLYELLTGATPFDRDRLHSAAFDELLRIIREEEPPKPSLRLSTSESLPSIADNRHTEPKKLSTLVHGELDWIVMKTLEKDRTRRYESANALAADIERHLNDEPVEACPPSTRYKLKKLVRRHKVFLVATAVVVSVLILGLIGTGWQAMRAARARDSALLAEARATENLDQALAAVDQMLTRVADEKLQSIPFLDEVRRDLLEDAAEFYEHLRKNTPDDRRLRLESAMAERRMANILHQLGRTSEAKKSIDRSIKLLSDAARQSPDNEKVQLELARSRFLAGNVANAPLQSERAVELLEQLSADGRLNREVRSELAFGLSRLANCLQNTGDRSKAEEAYSKAERVYEDLFEDRAPDHDLSLSYAKHLQNYGTFFMDSGDWKAAEAKYRKAMKTCKALITQDEPRRRNQLVYSAALGNLGHALYRQNRSDEAAALCRQAIEIQRKLVRDYPSVPDYRLHLAGFLMSMGGYYRLSENLTEGLSLAEEAVRIVEYLTDTYPAVAKYHRVHGGALNNVALLGSELNQDLERAEQAATLAIKHQQRALQANPEDPTANQYLLSHYATLARIRMQRQRFQEVATACREGLEIGERLLISRPDHGPIAHAVSELRKMRQVADDRNAKTDSPGAESTPSRPTSNGKAENTVQPP